METQNDARDNFIRALSNYSVCIKPYLRVAQERYVASYYSIEEQQVDFDKYCAPERALANAAAAKFKTSIDQA